MFIKLYDAKTNVNLIIGVAEIVAVKDYLAAEGKERIDGARSVVMTRPLGEKASKTHDYFVTENLDNIFSLIKDALND